MKKINFFIDGNHALVVDGNYIDLHNNFDFEYFKYSVKQNKVTISWIKAVGDWVQADEYKKISMIFENIILLRMKNESIDISRERSTLLFIGYLHPEEINFMDGCLDEKEATSLYHLILSFEDGFTIKIFADSVSCLIETR